MSIQNLIDLLTTQFQTRLDQINAARVAAVDAVQSLIAAFRINRSVRVYIDAINGDDSNTGSTADAPVKTWAAVISRARKAELLDTRALSDFVIDSAETMTSPPSRIRIWSEPAGHKITIKDDKDNPARAGGLVIHGSIDIEILNLDIEMDYAASLSPVTCTGSFSASIGNSTISRTGTGAALFNTADAHFEVINTIIEPAASGNIIRDVGAGEDPNATNGISANFTTA